MNTIKKSVLALAAAAILTLSSVSTANAASTANDANTSIPIDSGSQKSMTAQSLNLTTTRFAEGIDELKASPLPRTVRETPTARTTTFTLEYQTASLQFSVVEPRFASNESLGSGTTTPRIGGGIDRDGVYILFNQFDQDMIIAGTGFALGAAICAIPAVGTVACIVVGAVLTVASVWLSANGKCKNNKQLKVYSGRAGGCI